MSKNQTLSMKVDLEFTDTVSPGVPAERDNPEEYAEVNIECICIDGVELPDFDEEPTFVEQMDSLLEAALLELHDEY